MRQAAISAATHVVQLRPSFVPVAVPLAVETPEARLQRENHLLAAMPPGEFRRWLPHLEPVEMPLGCVLCEAGQAQGHVYFPATSIVSLLHQLENGSTSEVASVGNEGVVGISSFMGGHSMPSRAMVDTAGWGFRLQARVMLEAFQRSREVACLLLLYTQALVAQIGQTAVCNRHHALDQRLCGLLLRTLDRLPHGEFAMTQERIAILLGVRREGVTGAALGLQEAGLIRYHRGHISVLDRSGLERRTCECYSSVRNEFRRLLPDHRAQLS